MSTRFVSRVTLTSLVSALAALAFVQPSAAQERNWELESELGATLSFGNTRQSDLLARSAFERADSTYEFAVNGRFIYGEAADEGGDSFVNKRGWLVASNLDYRPFSLVSPFVFGSVESSFQRRIQSRASGGIGGKLTFNRDDGNRFDLSLALLAERTTPRDDVMESETLARWSGRVRYRRALGDDRLTFDSQTGITPAFENISDFTLTSTNSLTYELTQVVRLRVSFLDNYDSRAKERGARTNNDGQLIFSVVSSF
ncbi:MAG: DUF481 domain-containing protein [Gemmatimonadota bacterium]